MLKNRTRSAFPKHLFITVALTLGIWAAPRPAFADDDDSSTVLALDLDFAAPITRNAEPGGGGALRAGRKYSLLLASLTPEVGLGFYRFRGSSEPALYRAFVGGRFGLGTVIEPSAFAHIGIGKLDLSPGARYSPVADVGLALDFTLLPLLNLGVHGAYNALLPRSEYPAFRWFSVGVHAALEF